LDFRSDNQPGDKNYFFKHKTNNMAQRTNTDTGKPAGGGHPAQGTGVPTKINDENMANDQRLSEEYTRDEEEVKESVREMNPNRNVDKLGTEGH
jgi:hypothetical protein